MSCPEGYPFSDGNRISQNTCYKECPEKDITNETGTKTGKIKPDANIHMGDQQTECQYTKKNKIICNNTTNTCYGYHINTTLKDTVSEAELKTACISNVMSFSDEKGTGFTVHNDSNNKYYQTCIEANKHFEKTGTKCGQDYGGCHSDSVPCGSKLGGCNGSIENYAKWQNNQWNYSECTCKNDAPADISHGKGKLECGYVSGTSADTNWSSSSCTVYELSTCNAGYCQTNTGENKCNDIPAGYYSEGENISCEQCPIGSTSAGKTDATDITNCYITRGNGKSCDGAKDATCFCDNSGENGAERCFTLPGTGIIKYFGN